MNFSELFRQSNYLCKFSPDGKYLATASDYRLMIRDTESLQIQHLFSCLDAVQYIEWSSDSEFILTGLYKRGIVQVWSLEQPDRSCKIDEGSAGLCAVRWSPDSRHILTTADFHLRITVWSLVTKAVSYIRYPKDCEKGLDFSAGGKYMALAERRDCKDYVSIFACDSWELVKHFDTDTEDLAGLQWSPDGRVLVVWESVFTYQVLLYGMDGRCLAKFSAYDYGLGVKSLAWAPTSQFLAIGSFDQKVRMLNHLTWKKVAEFEHPTLVESSNVVVYKEVETRTPVPNPGLPASTATLFTAQSRFEVEPLPAKMLEVKPAPNKANPKMGIGTLAFSSDCKYLLSKNDNMPTAVWVWDVRRLALCAVLVLASPVKCVRWDPTRPRLALCTGGNKLYMWSPEGCLAVQVPSEATFQVQALEWHAEGGALLLLSKDHMCMCFLCDNAASAAASAAAALALEDQALS